MYTEIIYGFSLAVSDYMRDVKRQVEGAGLTELFGVPSAIGWKVENMDEFNKIIAVATDMGAEQIHIGRINDRYVASIHMARPVEGVSVLKIMQRRPDRNDLVGIDHIDFLVGSLEDVHNVLQSQSGVQFKHQSNHRQAWINVVFGDREAKLVDRIVFSVCVDELTESIADLHLEV